MISILHPFTFPAMNNKKFSAIHPHLLSWTLMAILGVFGWQTAKAQPGSALNLDGTGDYVSVASSSQNNISGTTITVEAWIYPTAWKTNYWDGGIVTKEGSTTGYMLRCGNSGQLGFSLGDGSAWHETSSATGALSLSKWQHVAGTYDGTTMRLFVNGVQVATNTSTFTITGNANNLVIGSADPYLGTREFQGAIDEVRVWNTARTFNELLSTNYKDLAGTETGLAAYYKMSNGSGITLTDNVSSGGTSGTFVGNTAWKTSNARLGSASDALKYRRAGTGLDFDGIDDYVVVADKAPLDLTNTFTIEAWINPVSLSASLTRILGKGDAYSFGLTNSIIRFTAQSVMDYDLSYAVNTGEWTHIAVVMDASNDVTFYVNGINRGTVAGATPVSVSAIDLYIGATSAGGGIEFFEGQIDEVRIWSSARTSTQIQDNMLDGIDPTTANLVALYRFDDATGTQVAELTTNVMTGTMTNMDAATDWVSTAGREPFKVWESAGSWLVDSTFVLGTAPTNSINNEWVEATRNVNILSNACYAGNLNIPSGVTLTSSNAQTLNLNGNLINNGIYNGTTGHLRFQDPNKTPVHTGSGTFQTAQYRVNTSYGVYLDQNISLSSTLFLQGGVFSINSNTVTLNSGISISGGGTMLGGSNSNLVIAGTAAAVTIPAITLNNLTITRPNGISLSGSMRIEGTLALNGGRINLNSRTLTIGTAGTITTSSSYSSSNMIRAYSAEVIKEFNAPGSFFFPIGDDGLVYTPISLEFTSGSFASGANVSVRVYNNIHPDNASADNLISRYWTVISNNITGFSCYVLATYDDVDIIGDESQLKSARWDATNWLIMGSADVDNNYIYGTVSDFYAYSDFTAGEEAFFATLPVEMLSFDAKANENTVDLNWVTTQEVNSDYFMVERATDGKTFSAIGKMNAAGLSETTLNYAMKDENPANGVNYYRLRQFDIDGTSHLSNTVEVSLKKVGIELFPNPATDGFWIVVPEDMTGFLFITNSLGKAVKVVPVTGGKQYVSTAGISSGVYYGAFVLRGLKNVVEKIVIE